MSGAFASAPQAAPPSVAVTRLAEGRWGATFEFRPARADAHVSLAGSFNGWNVSATPMERMGDGAFRATVELPAGRHLYKFVIDGGKQWVADPANPQREDDGQGGFNSVIELGAGSSLEASFDASRARAGDGAIEAAACLHDPARAMWMQQTADGGALVRYRTLAHDVESVALALDDEAPQAMSRAARVRNFDWWEIRVPKGRAETAYSFVVSDGAAKWNDPARFRVPVFAAAVPFHTPDWAKGAVWYQIMVDRFRNGDTANDPDNTRPWKSDWAKPSAFELDSDGQPVSQWGEFFRLYGGDIAGVRAEIPYLKSLGVTAVYLNPVFEAPSPHKYDARSYVHIDDNFGTKGDYAAAVAREDLLAPGTWTLTASDRAFIDLVAAMHANGIKVVIDGVFNHVGDTHEAFADVRQNGAKSRFADWFAIRSFEPFAYDGWAGFGQLPAFAKSTTGFASDAVRRHIYAITRRWMDPNGDGDPSDGVDGWRLDVPNEVPMQFWHEWRALVKSVNPDAYISGEIWKRADEWLDGRTFDAVMNYPFAASAVAWVANKDKKISASELDARLAELRLAYPLEVTPALMNLVDSHDTDRVASMMRNPDRGFDQGNRPKDNPAYDGSKPRAEDFQRQRLLALVQATYIGAPMIWYGDEAGMWGADDPLCRKPMVWSDLGAYDNAQDAVDAEQLAQYRAIFALRTNLAALRTGGFRTLLTDDAKDLWVFERWLGDERVLVAINASDSAQSFALPAAEFDGWRWRLVFGGALDGAATGFDAVPARAGRVILGTH